MDVPCDRAAPAAVRQSISGLERLGWIIGDAMFVASELVTNAVLNARCSPEDLLHVRVDESADGIVVSVQDGESSDARKQALPAATSLGLQLVAALSRRWGSSHKNGYEVWAELAR